MISGAVYQSGIARTEDGAVYITETASTLAPTKGTTINPPAKSVADGAVYVRFV